MFVCVCVSVFVCANVVIPELISLNADHLYEFECKCFRWVCVCVHIDVRVRYVLCVVCCVCV